METGAAVLLGGVATILVIHTLRNPDDARRYARFLLTGRGPGGQMVARSAPVSATAPPAAPQPALQRPPARTQPNRSKLIQV